MEALIIEPTGSTPKIILDKDSGKFEISGKSFPEEGQVFYNPVFKWLENYAQNPNDETIFEFKMEYFNSSSSLLIHEILNLLHTILKQGKKLTVNWYHLEVDEDMLDAGEEYAELVKIPFSFKAVKEF